MPDKVETAVEINFTTKDAGGSVKSIKTELREAKLEAVAMAREFGSTSTEAVNAAKKVAKLKDEIEDVAIAVKGVNPDKFARIASIGSGIAQGFVAAQGAMALFGSESKDLEKTMIKLQGAIALSQGLQGLKDLRLALGALFGPIAIAAAAIGLIVTNWKELSKAIEGIFPGFKVVTDFFKNLKQNVAGVISGITAAFSQLGKGFSALFSGKFQTAFTEFSKVGSVMAEAFNEGFAEKDKELQLLKSIADRKFQLDLLQAQGKDVMAARLQLQKDELSLLETGSDEYNAKLIEIATTQTAIRQKALDNQKANQEKFNKDFADIQAKAQKEIANEILRGKLEIDAQKKKNAEKKANETDLTTFIIAETKRAGALQVASAQSVSDQIRGIAHADLQEQKDLQNLKLEIAKQGFQGLADLAFVFAGQSEEGQKRAFEVQKLANAANVIIDTYKAATAAYASLSPIPIVGPALGAIAAGAAIAAGLANLKRIKETKFNSNSISATSAPSSNIQAPSINTPVSQQRNTASFGTGATGQNTQSGMVKVIVTETDITRAQARVRTIQRRAVVR